MLKQFFKQHYPIVLVLSFSLLLRLLFLDRFGFWDGEIHTIFHSARPLNEIPTAYRDNTAHPPLWFILTHILLLAETGPWLYRLPAVLFGVSSIAAAYILVDRAYDRIWAIGVAGLLSILPISLRWSQSARMYTLFLFLSILTCFYCLDILQKQKEASWIGFSIVSLLNLYTHYFSLFPLLI